MWSLWVSKLLLVWTCLVPTRINNQQLGGDNQHQPQDQNYHFQFYGELPLLSKQKPKCKLDPHEKANKMLTLIQIMAIIRRSSLKFSVAKATLHSQMSVRLSVCLQNPSTAWNHHLASFILHHSSFLIHPSFISRLLSFSACLLLKPFYSKIRLFMREADHYQTTLGTKVWKQTRVTPVINH